MASFSIGNSMLSSNMDEYKKLDFLLPDFVDNQRMKELFVNCLRVNLANNNDKAYVVRKIMEGSGAIEIGTGTNRIAYRYKGFVIKIALDRRGLVDNFQEFKRSTESPEFLAKTYETNYLINIAEYIEIMDQSTFITNESRIKEMLSRLSNNYLFNDLGFTLVNFYNWGVRESRMTDDEREEYGMLSDYMYDICIADYGYLYPLYGQKERLFTCPKCGHELRWNSAYTDIQCTNIGPCQFKILPEDLRSLMNLEFEEFENAMINDLNNIQMPDLHMIEGKNIII